MAGVFGRRNNSSPATPASESSGGTTGDNNIPEGKFPWSGRADAVACNLAFGDLCLNLPARFATDGRIHAETLLAAAGAIAGFAAQNAFVGNAASLNIITTRDGSRYLFGEPLNEMLFARSEEQATERLWNVAVGAAMGLGAARADLPGLEPIFAHVSKTIGGDSEGLPSVSKSHHPHLPVKRLLPLVWPLALTCLTGRGSGAKLGLGPVNVKNWPMITAYVAASMMGKVNGALDPVTALTVVMESSVYASKLDPRLVRAQEASA